MPTSEPGEERAGVPLSHSQRDVWLAEQTSPESSLAFSRGARVGFTGLLDLQRLRQGLRSLVERHELLRATVSRDGSHLVVRGQMEPELTVVELAGAAVGTHGSQSARTAGPAAAQCARAAMLEPFDLEYGPLIRFRLLRYCAERHDLLILAHSIIVDTGSFATLLSELAALYSGLVPRAAADGLPKMTNAGGSVTAERRSVLPTSEVDRSFWLERLRNPPASLALPHDRVRLTRRTYAAAALRHELDSAVTAGVREFAVQQRAVVAEVLIAAFGGFAHRLTGDKDVIVGVVVGSESFGRQRRTIDGCANILPVRLSVDGSILLDLLSSTQATLRDAAVRRPPSFGELLRELSLPSDERRPPLVSVVFEFEMREELQFAGLTSHYEMLRPSAELFECRVNVVDSGLDLHIDCSYNSDLYSEAMMRSLLRDFEIFLQAACARPQGSLSGLPLLSAARRKTIVNEWNATGRDYDLAMPLHAWIARAASKWPDATALLSERGAWTYRELERRADALALRLRQRGIGRDRIVGICAHRSAEMVVALLATLKAGAAYLPLDPDYPPERLTLMNEEAECAVILAALQPEAVSTSRKSLAPPASAAANWLSHCGGDVISIDLDAGAAPDVVAQSAQSQQVMHHADADSLAYVIYTSGSTGKPKGTLLTHRGIVNRLLWMQEQYAIGPGDRVLQKTPYSFDVSVWEFFWPLMAGATLILAGPDGHADPQYLIELIEREHISVCHFVPSMLRVMLDCPQFARCRSLRHVFASGEALPYAQTERFYQCLPQSRLHNLYGPTEASVDVSYWECPPQEPRRLVPIGRPAANTALYVLDEQLEVRPVGAVGELYVGGVQLARGYLKRPELTLERFIAHPQFGRLYRTGDLARWLPDGVVDFLGRDDSQVKVQGQRIELGEIEAELMALPEIAAAACAVRERNPGDARLVAWIVLRDAHSLDLSGLRARLRERLPDYLLPQFIVELSKLPLLSSGKTNRNALPDPFATGRLLQAAAEPPVGETEQLIANLWLELLRAQRVSRHDRFFDLGGHSFLAVQMAARLENHFGRRPPLRAVMMETLAGLAQQFSVSMGPASARESPPLPSVDTSLPTVAPALFEDVFHFGVPGWRMAGFLKSPAGNPRTTAILICHSWGTEYMRSYGALKRLAARLSEQGFAVLRFDYAGTGDSEGDAANLSSAAWPENICAAAEQLKRRSGAAAVCVVGLRLGALLAAAAVNARLDASHLVLWDAPADGRCWIEEMRRLDREIHLRWNMQRTPAAKLAPLEEDELLGMRIPHDFGQLSLLAGARAIRNVELMGAFSADANHNCSDAGATLALLDEGHWNQPSWVTTPWNPAASIAAMTAYLAACLP